MPIVLYIICVFSFFQSSQSGSPGCLVLVDTQFDTGVSWPTPTISLATTQILDLHEEITDAKAFACYKLYERELSGKSQEELNRLLKQCLSSPQPYYERSLYRQKAIALLLYGAQPTKYAPYPALLNAAIYNDIPFARYICTHYPEDPNQMNQMVYTIHPLWFYCKSPEMAQLMVKYGADLGAKSLNGNILHSLCLGSVLNVPLVQFYCSKCPSLLDELNTNRDTPLVLFLKRLSTTTSIASIADAYLLINLGSKTDILITTGEYTGKSCAELVRSIAQKQNKEKARNKFLALAKYIERPPKIRSTLFEQLWDQWKDKLDA